MEYIYLGDRNTSPTLRGQACKAVRKNAKCLRGKNGAMLVEFADGKHCVVIARLLRKMK